MSSLEVEVKDMSAGENTLPVITSPMGDSQPMKLGEHTMASN